VTAETSRFYYGWVIVIVSFLTLFFTLGIGYSVGVFYVAILKEYGWGRAETAGAFSLALLIHGFFSIVTGNLIDRFGPRRLFPLGAVFLGIGLAVASRISAIWHLYVFLGVIMAIGINIISFPPHVSRIPKWFIRKAGLASGLVLAGTGAGIMVLAPFIQFMIDTMGWRFAFLVLGVMVISVLVPVTALFQRRSPEEVGQFPDGIVPAYADSPLKSQGGTRDTRSPHIVQGWTARAAVRTRAFWWIALMNFSIGFVINMMVVHQAAHMVDAGYSAALAALVVGLLGPLRSGGGVLCGYLSDRMGREIAYTLGNTACAVGVLCFLLIRDTTAPWMLYIFVVLYGLGHGATGPVYAMATADLFPGDSLGRIFGTLSIAFGIGGALGTYLGGYFHDQLGSYTVPFLLVVLVTGVGILAIWLAAPRRRRIYVPS
jgi:MFS family permease